MSKNTSNLPLEEQIRRVLPNDARINRIEDVVSRRQRGLIILEDIYDPHNAAAVLRSADAFGFQSVYIIFDRQNGLRADRLDKQKFHVGKQSSAGVKKWLDVEIFRSSAEAFAKAKSSGYRIYGTALSETSVDIFSADLTSPDLALALGNEHDGLSPEAIQSCDQILTIPMAGMAQSLNLSVTAAICLFEIHRQRKLNGVDRYLLPEVERQQLAQRMLEKA